MSESQSKQKKSGAGFFHIDRRTWKLVCGRNDINQAASYLVVAAGTGAGNRVSRWSALSVEKYTGLHRDRAKAALTELIAADYLRRDESSRRTRPVYEIQPFDVAYGVALDAAQRGAGVFDLITRATTGKGWEEKTDRLALAPYVLQGLLWPAGNLFDFRPDPDIQAPNAECIWLPNSLVTGVDGKHSPIWRLRSVGDLWALRLLVDLYHAQNLSADSGISRLTLYGTYTRKEYGRRGRHVVWGFAREKSFAPPEHRATEAFWQAASLATGEYVEANNHLWKSVNTLADMGLLTRVPHLAENSRLDCELIHGFGSKDVGEDIERELAEAAECAAWRIIGSLGAPKQLWGKFGFVVPVWDTQTEVQMVDVYRLTYRPHTNLTRDWMRRLGEIACGKLSEYAGIQPAAATANGNTAQSSISGPGS